jgi:hypothetical protein
VTAPLCRQCGVRPVKPKKRSFPVEALGMRIIDGVRWAWYCSRQCNGQAVGELPQTPANARAASRANVLKAERRMLARLVAVCRDVMDDQQRVPLKALVRAAMAEGRRQYGRGFGAGVYAERRRQSRAA